MGGIEKIERNGKILAIIARASSLQQLEEENKEMFFMTPDEFPFQVGVHNRKSGGIIKPHVHLPFEELKDFPVQEFFYMISGKVKIDLYDNEEGKDIGVGSVIVESGDTIVLNTGHGFTFLEDSKLVELKQGPYRGREKEKRFVKDG